MRKVRKGFLTLLLSMTMMLGTSMTVFATEGSANTEQTVVQEGVMVHDSGTAVEDILMNPRFEGAISSITWLTNIIDNYFIMIISVVAFFIISAALLKNVCAGAYCANSKFWDKVDTAHKRTEALSIASVKNYFGGKQFMNTTLGGEGGIGQFFLGFVPNIKAFTDFEEADIEPKAYFMKSIPQMIACVIIGIFIYNGFYRDTAATVGEMGSVLIDRTLKSVNPESFVNKLFNQTSWPKFAWNGDKSREGQFYLELCKELKSLVASNCTDITSSNDKANVVANITNAITGNNSACLNHDFLVQSASYLTADGGDYVYKASGFSSYVAPLNAGVGSGDNVLIEDEAGNVNVLLMFDMSQLAVSQDINTGNQCAYISYTLKKVKKDGTNGSSTTDVGKLEAMGYTSIPLATDTVYASATVNSVNTNGPTIVRDLDVDLSSVVAPDLVDALTKNGGYLRFYVGAKAYDVFGTGQDGTTIHFDSIELKFGSDGRAKLGHFEMNGVSSANVYISLSGNGSVNSSQAGAALQ